MLKYEPETKNVKKLKGPCVVVIHAEWCGHCEEFMPVYKNEIVPSNNFDEELKDLLTLTSIEDKEYSNAKDLFGNIDGYPTIRYMTFDQSGKPLKDNNGAIVKIDAENIPRDAKAVTKWINTVVKNDVQQKHKKHNHAHNNKRDMNSGMRGGSKKTKRVIKRVMPPIKTLKILKGCSRKEYKQRLCGNFQGLVFIKNGNGKKNKLFFHSSQERESYYKKYMKGKKEYSKISRYSVCSKTKPTNTQRLCGSSINNRSTRTTRCKKVL